MQTHGWEAEPDPPSVFFSSFALHQKLQQNASIYHKASLVGMKREGPCFRTPRGAPWNTPVLPGLAGSPEQPD